MYYSFYYGQPVMSPSDFIKYRHDIAISNALLGPNRLCSLLPFFGNLLFEVIITPNQMSHSLHRIFEIIKDNSLSTADKKSAVKVYLSTYKEWVRETVALSAQFYNKVSAIPS